MFGSVADDAVVDVIGQMHGIENAARRVFLSGLVAIDQRDAWREDGALNVEMWVEMRFGVAHGTARELVRMARALVFCPTLAATFDAGHLSWDQLLAAVDLVAFGGVDEAAVAADAVGKPAAELTRLARRARRVPREETLERLARTYLRVWWDTLGMLRVNGRLADEMGKTVEAALRRLAEDQPHDPNGQARPFEERQAHALFDLASARLAADAEPAAAAVVIHVDAHALAGDNHGLDLAALQLGPLVSMATAHRLACDGSCQVVVDDLLGRTVEVAKTTHAVPRWMRRRALNRDGGCRWPACWRTAMLHVHHIRWWTRDGGLTEESNLVMLCSYHHRLVHEHGWAIEGDPIGRLTFRDARGRAITSGPPGLRPDIRQRLGLAWSGDPPHQAA